MVPNLLSPHPFNAPLLPLLRFRASSLSSPRREIGLMKLKGMGLSQHCGFQWHCLILPPLPSAGTPPTPSLPTPPPTRWHRRITATIYNAPRKRSLSHAWHQRLSPALPGHQLRGKCWKRGNADGCRYVACVGHFRSASGLKWIACLFFFLFFLFEDKPQRDGEALTCFSHLSQSDPVKGVLLLPVLLGVVSNGNGADVLWDYSVRVCTRYINMISSSHIAYFFPSPWKTIEKKRIRNQIFWSVPPASGLRPTLRPQRWVRGPENELSHFKCQTCYQIRVEFVLNRRLMLWSFFQRASDIRFWLPALLGCRVSTWRLTALPVVLELSRG